MHSDMFTITAIRLRFYSGDGLLPCRGASHGS